MPPSPIIGRPPTRPAECSPRSRCGPGWTGAIGLGSGASGRKRFRPTLVPPTRPTCCCAGNCVAPIVTCGCAPSVGCRRMRRTPSAGSRTRTRRWLAWSRAADSSPTRWPGTGHALGRSRKLSSHWPSAIEKWPGGWPRSRPVHRRAPRYYPLMGRPPPAGGGSNR
jgi:hypothetical protein